MNIAVFASGAGSSFQVLIDKQQQGLLQAHVAVLFCNNSTVQACDRARTNGIAVVHCAPSHFSDPAQYCEKLSQELALRKIDLIVLAGYMKLLPSAVVALYRNRILNIHPALLPAFGGKGMYGKRVHQAVIEYGAKISGLTIHFVDEEYDRGPVIFQRAVAVNDDDTAETLASRILCLEHQYYWQVIQAIIEKKITVAGRKVIGTIEPNQNQ
ncbi:MAG: phosphoribosylglycinamide formyltransferase [Chitinivibrionales bacterium]|nr:phosphoribosylglycinamide formyltransferase [Chitinivibrionales bacterium]